VNYLKSPAYRSKRWLQAVASLPCRACFKDGPSQAAHVNHRGKGMGMKAPDVWTFPMCPACHAEFDQGKSYTKEQRRALADEWVLSTILELATSGKVVPK
jgi:hypothetical protein